MADITNLFIFVSRVSARKQKPRVNLELEAITHARHHHLPSAATRRRRGAVDGRHMSAQGNDRDGVLDLASTQGVCGCGFGLQFGDAGLRDRGGRGSRYLVMDIHKVPVLRVLSFSSQVEQDMPASLWPGWPRMCRPPHPGRH